MFYYKVININKGKIDYKNLDINKNIPGSQYYPSDLNKDDYCILINQEDVQHKEIIKLTKEEYEELKKEIVKQYPTTQEEIESQRIQKLETALLEATTLIALQEQKANQNEQAILELTNLIGVI